MLIVISPAKSLDFETPPASAKHTQPEWLDRSEKLVRHMRRMSRPKLAALMGISDTLADENARRFKAWTRPFTPANARQAIFAFRGDVYQEFRAEELSAEELDRAQDRLRILSGLHGVLRPLDLIQPYRLEMGLPVKVDRRANLYAFWGDAITERLNSDMKAAGTRLLVNLASREYFGAVDPAAVDGEVITPLFKERRNGQLRQISFSAKRARGMMARHLVRTGARGLDDIAAFRDAGYRLSRSGSTDGTLLFTRSQPKAP